MSVEKLKNKLSSQFPKWRLASGEYKTQNSKFDFRCPNDHIVSKSYKALNKDGLNCRLCSIENDVRSLNIYLSKYGVSMISDHESISKGLKEFVCKYCNCTFKETVVNIKSRKIKCPICEPELKGYLWQTSIYEKILELGLEYLNSDPKTLEVSYLCQCGREKKTIAKGCSDIKSSKCIFCSRQMDHTEVKNNLSSVGLDWIGGKYEGNCSKLILKCSEGHIFRSSYANSFTARSKCVECSNRMSTEDFYKLANTQLDGYEISRAFYKGRARYLTVTCPNNHTYDSSVSNFIQKSSRCQRCYFTRLEEEKIDLEYDLGNYYDVIKKIRSSLFKWRKLSLESAGYRCSITGVESELEVHHVVPFRKILKDAEIETDLLLDRMKKITHEEILILIESVKQKHDIPGFVLHKDLHSELHSIYGKNTTVKDLEEFIIDKLFDQKQA